MEKEGKEGGGIRKKERKKSEFFACHFSFSVSKNKIEEKKKI